MIDLNELHDDEIVKEIQCRLDRGTVGYHGLYSSNQQDYRNMWWELCDLVNTLSNEKFDDFYLISIRNKIKSLADGASMMAPSPYAINTTFYGKDAAQNHAPE